MRVPCKALHSNESGQVIVEYILVAVVVLSIFVFFARPQLGKLGKNISENLQGGIFSDDPSGSGFYYFPVK